MSLIDGALADTLARVGMYVGENLELPFPAILPQRRIADRVESDGTGSLGFGIKIVIANMGRHAAENTVLLAQQEGPAFAFALAPAPQLVDNLGPKQKRDADDGGGRIRRQGSHHIAARNEILRGNPQLCDHWSRLDAAVLSAT